VSSATADPVLGPFDELAGVVDRLAERRAYAGAVVALAVGDAVPWMHATGTALTPTGRAPMTTRHRFLLTSVTKSFMALQVMRLVADGTLAVTTPVADVVGGIPAHGGQVVTLGHLLTHTSGIREDETTNTAEHVNPGMRPADHLAAAMAAPLDFVPGTRVAYCSPPFWLLAEILRRTTGRDHVEDLREELCGPLGLERTGYELAADPPSDLVLTGSDRYGAVMEQVRRIAYPAGGIVSDAADLVRYGGTHLRCRRGDGRGATSAMHSPLIWEPRTVGLPGPRGAEGVAERTERACGWAVGGPGRLRSDAALWHSGSSGTSIWIDPEADAVVVILSADFGLSYDDLGQVCDAALAGVAGA
jgi:serine-type D-Ala-D-Ala carboxypeptidase